MNFWDVLIRAAVALAGALAALQLYTTRKRGGCSCGECSSCGACPSRGSCSSRGACPSCGKTKAAKDHKVTEENKDGVGNEGSGENER